MLIIGATNRTGDKGRLFYKGLIVFCFLAFLEGGDYGGGGGCQAHGLDTLGP